MRRRTLIPNSAGLRCRLLRRRSLRSRTTRGLPRRPRRLRPARFRPWRFCPRRLRTRCRFQLRRLLDDALEHLARLAALGGAVAFPDVGLVLREDVFEVAVALAVAEPLDIHLEVPLRLDLCCFREDRFVLFKIFENSGAVLGAAGMRVDVLVYRAHPLQTLFSLEPFLLGTF